MASAGTPGTTGGDAIQFDHAEFTTAAPGALACRACQQPINDVYYEINQNLLCDPCRRGVEDRFLKGPGFGGFVKASALGLLAAIAGTVITYTVMAVAHISAGIISILVGYMVGTAVRKGTGNRGGLKYQLLAVFLTYSAVAWSFIPLLAKELAEKVRPPQAEKRVDPGKGRVVEVEPGKPGQEAPARPAPAPAADPGGGEEGPNPVATLLAVGVFSAVIVAIAYVAPFLGLPGNIIGVLIIFFGLQQAWRLNRKVDLRVNGPFRVGDGGLTAGGVGVAHV